MIRIVLDPRERPDFVKLGTCPTSDKFVNA